MEPFLFNDVISVMRYHYDNVIDLGDHLVQFKRSDIGTELYKTLGYLLGFNWEMNRNWSVMLEAGFGGSRENFIAGATYRF
jgi:hypothetical protein